MANSWKLQREIDRAHICPKCGEKMRKIDDKTGLWAKCPRENCGHDYYIFYRTKKVDENPPKQLSMFTHENDGLPF